MIGDGGDWQAINSHCPSSDDSRKEGGGVDEVLVDDYEGGPVDEALVDDLVD